MSTVAYIIMIVFIAITTAISISITIKQPEALLFTIGILLAAGMLSFSLIAALVNLSEEKRWQERNICKRCGRWHSSGSLCDICDNYPSKITSDGWEETQNFERFTWPSGEKGETDIASNLRRVD